MVIKFEFEVEIPDAILEAVVKRHNASKFKRKQLPIKINRDEIV